MMPSQNPSPMPTSTPTSFPSYKPSVPPTMLPTTWDDFKLIINSQFIIQCKTLNSFHQWFVKNTYFNLTKQLVYTFSENSYGFLQYHQFDLHLQTIYHTYNVSKLPTFFEGNVSVLGQKSKSLVDIYNSQVSKYKNDSGYLMNVSLQLEIYAMVAVESVFHQFFYNDILKSSIEVCISV